MTQRGRIAYLCLQSIREGQAAFAHVHEIIGGLERRGWSVELFAPDYAPGAPPGVLRRLAEFRRLQLALKARLSAVDVVYIRSHPLAFAAAGWARRAGVPVVQESNGTDADLLAAWPGARPLAAPLRMLAVGQYRSADAVIAVAEGIARWIEAGTGRDDVVVVPNGADTAVFRPDASGPEGLPERYVAFVGAFAPWQGLGILLQAVERPEWPEDVGLVVAGDGADRSVVEAAAARSSRVTYLGTVPYEEVPGILAGSIAGMSPKYTGSSPLGARGMSPLKVYETLASGVPAVVTDYPGQTEVIRAAECGIVVPPGDTRALAEAVAHLASDPAAAAAMGERGREAILRAHSWDERAGRTESVLLGVLADRRGETAERRP